MKNKKLILLCCVTYFYVGMCNAMNSIPVSGLPANISFVGMQKTVKNNNLESIDLLFKHDKEQYFWQYHPYLKGILKEETNVSCISDSINMQDNRAMGIQNKYAGGALLPTVPTLYEPLHKTPIEKIKIDSTYLVTQSTFPTIRFWEKLWPQNNIKDSMVKEISKAWLLEYKEGAAIWAKRNLLNNNILTIYIGFNFSKQGKSFIFKKDIHDFVTEKEIMAMSFIDKSYMPACFLEQDHAALFNERKKEINIITYTEKPISTNNKKKVGAIETTSIHLKDFKSSKNNTNATELLYRTPKKIDYNKSNGTLVFVYDDRIIKCKLVNKEYRYKNVTHINASYVSIVDVIFHDHSTVYVLTYNQSTKTHELLIYNI